MEKIISKKLKLHQKNSNFKYWQKQPYQFRIDVLEEIREEYNKWRFNAQQGFQRFYKIVKRK